MASWNVEGMPVTTVVSDKPIPIGDAPGDEQGKQDTLPTSSEAESSTAVPAANASATPAPSKAETKPAQSDVAGGQTNTPARPDDAPASRATAGNAGVQAGTSAVPIQVPGADARTAPVNGIAVTAQNLRAETPVVIPAVETTGGPSVTSVEGLKGNSAEEALLVSGMATDAYFTQATEALAAVDDVDVPAAETTPAPQAQGLLGTGLTFDLPAVEQSVARFFDKLDHLGGQLAAVPETAGLPPWLPALAAAGVALEITRRQLRSGRRDENGTGAEPDATINWSIGLGQLPG